MKRRKKKGRKSGIREVDIAVLNEIVERTKQAPLNEEDRMVLTSVVETLMFLQEEIRGKNVSLRRLKNLLFGARTEKTSEVIGGAKKEAGVSKKPGGKETGKAASGKTKRKGHGRNGISAYPGAKRIPVPYAELHHGERCPACEKGNVYEQKKPSMLVRVTAMAPVQADVYVCERLRCNGCGKVFTAKAPAGVGAKKYDESVASMVGTFKYGAGMPFNRLEKLQAALGLPLPAGTQWQLIDEAVEALEPAFQELVRQAAQGEVLHNDDTPMKILNSSLEAEAKARERKRTGMFTTGIIAKAGARCMALFYTGRNHAGENLAEVLAHREKDLSEPIQMCDALSRNTSGDLKTIVANCIAHARRRFVDIVENFPDECRYVLETLREVYHNDADAREQTMTPEARLRFHQQQSGPLLKDLQQWFQKQFGERKVEPNSGLGEAIQYMQNHWKELTLFLREPGAPLDNNLCERALKKAILHRKNSYFFKTENGARVGDIFMSLIHTTELNGENPFEYLLALQRHADKVRTMPSDWMPWNFRSALPAGSMPGASHRPDDTSLSTGPDPPS